LLVFIFLKKMKNLEKGLVFCAQIRYNKERLLRIRAKTIRRDG